MSNHERLVYERDSWYDEYIVDDDYIDDGSVVYEDGHVEKVKTIQDKGIGIPGMEE